MAGKPVFAAQAQPNFAYVFTPHPEYWIVAGDFTEGDALEPDELTNAEQVSFDGGTSLVATLDASNIWNIKAGGRLSGPVAVQDAVQADGRGEFGRAIEHAAAEHLLHTADPVRDRAVTHVEQRGGRGRVEAGLQVAAERVPQNPIPWIRRRQRSEFVLDETARGSYVAQQRGLQRDVVVAGHRLR